MLFSHSTMFLVLYLPATCIYKIKGAIKTETCAGAQSLHLIELLFSIHFSLTELVLSVLKPFQTQKFNFSGIFQNRIKKLFALL